jgi:cephalosporin hydroxylase
MTPLPPITLTPLAASRWRPGVPGCADEDLLAVYHALAPTLLPTPICVEIGTAWGRSVLYLASELLRLGRKGSQVWAVDSCLGAAAPEGAQAVSCHGWITSLHRHAYAAELEILYPVRAPSVQAARLFGGASVDLVSIDAEHNYPRLWEDIAAWLYLVRPGGWIMGHDLSPQFPGVKQAVQEMFGATYATHGTVWAVQV